MRLKIGLATLIGLISITGAVAATGGISVFGIDLPVAAPASKIDLKGSTEYLSANCWAVTGDSNGGSCATSANAPAIPGLPGLPELDLPALPGVPSLPALPGLPGVPPLPVAVPTACGSPVAGAIPAPTGSLKTATDAVKGAEAQVKSALSGVTVPSLPLPVSLPSLPSLPVPNVLDTVTKELGCASTSASPASSTPQLCNVTVPGAPVALPLPAEAGALVGTIAKDLKSLTGQSLPAIGGTSVGASCSVDSSKLPSPTSLIPSPTSVTKGLKVPQPSSLVPGLPKLPNINNTLGGLTDNLPIPGVSSLPVPGVSGAVGTVTGLVTDVLSVVGAPSCSASGGLVSGILGTITASASC